MTQEDEYREQYVTLYGSLTQAEQQRVDLLVALYQKERDHAVLWGGQDRVHELRESLAQRANELNFLELAQEAEAAGIDARDPFTSIQKQAEQAALAKVGLSQRAGGLSVT